MIFLFTQYIIGVAWVRKLEGLKVSTVFPKNDTIALSKRKNNQSENLVCRDILRM